VPAEERHEHAVNSSDSPSSACDSLGSGSEPVATASRWFDVREVAVAIDEQWMRVRRSLEEKLGVEEASYLMDRPMGGWSELVTNHTLDLKFEVVDERFRSIDERFRALDDRLDARFDAIDVRFAALEGKLETSIASLRYEFVAELEQRFEALAWKLVTAVIAAIGVTGALFGVLVALLA
jgi:hypothetical protein